MQVNVHPLGTCQWCQCSSRQRAVRNCEQGVQACARGLSIIGHTAGHSPAGCCHARVVAVGCQAGKAPSDLHLSLESHFLRQLLFLQCNGSWMPWYMEGQEVRAGVHVWEEDVEACRQRVGTGQGREQGGGWARPSAPQGRR